MPTHIDSFSHGLLVPLLAYLMSCIGALLGLMATSRARLHTGGQRAAWLTLGVVSIGGTGIWVMHFIAMLGASVPDSELRYDLSHTLVSALMAILIVGAGLFTIGFAPRTPTVLLVSGTITGLGIVAMHYTGMAALHLNGSVHYDAARVIASVVIGVVACTAALWAALYVRGSWAMAGAALVMGIAVSGMHYTGMSAANVTLSAGFGTTPPGFQAEAFLLPMIIGVSALTVVVLFIVMLSPNEEEILEDRARLSRREGLRSPDRTIFDG